MNECVLSIQLDVFVMNIGLWLFPKRMNGFAGEAV